MRCYGIAGIIDLNIHTVFFAVFCGGFLQDLLELVFGVEDGKGNLLFCCRRDCAKY